MTTARTLTAVRRLEAIRTTRPRHLSTSSDHDRSLEHYARIERARAPNESFLDALTRIAIIDFMADCADVQSVVAHYLSITPRALNYQLAKIAHPAYRGIWRGDPAGSAKIRARHRAREATIDDDIDTPTTIDDEVNSHA